MPLLANHIAVVTGAASGIGSAIAVGFAREGARVVLLDINEEGAREVTRQIRDAGFDAESIRLDVTRREDCFAIASRIAKEIGQVSVLVNDAGINRRNAFTADAEAVLRDWQDIMAINLNGVFNVTHAFLEPLKAAKGRIINIGSIQSFMHVRTPTLHHFQARRARLHPGARRGTRQAWRAGQRHRARTDRDAVERKRACQRPGLVKTFIDHTPLGRAGQPEDIVGPAIFLASDLSSYVTGSIVMADGGYRTI